MKKIIFLTIFLIATTLFAGNPDTMRACGNIGFTKNRDLNVCMKSGAEADAIIACTKIGTKDMSIINECITSGAHVEKITNCTRKSSDLSILGLCIKS